MSFQGQGEAMRRVSGCRVGLSPLVTPGLVRHLSDASALVANLATRGEQVHGALYAWGAHRHGAVAAQVLRMHVLTVAQPAALALDTGQDHLIPYPKT